MRFQLRAFAFVFSLTLCGTALRRATRRGLLLALALASFAPAPAFAVCSGSPTGNEGDIIYNSTNHIMLYCNGTAWISMGGSSGGTPGGSTTQLQFNNAGAFGGDSALTWDNTNKRLGLGGVTPLSTLAISGGVAIGTTYAGTNAAGSNNLIVQGNIGVGSASPAYTVDASAGTVAGSIMHVAPQASPNTGSGLTNGAGVAKAWVNFVGTSAGCPSGTCTITDGYNVSSVTRLAAGAYRVTFTTALSNANYAVLVTTTVANASGYAVDEVMMNRYSATGTSTYTTVSPTTTSFVFGTPVTGYTNGTDNDAVSVVVFGN